jgi:hypothetical protein
MRPPNFSTLSEAPITAIDSGLTTRDTEIRGAGIPAAVTRPP